MKKKFFITNVLFVIIIFLSTAGASIKESNNIKDLFNHISPDTMVLFDIDNTILQPKQTLGSDQWYTHMVKTFKKNMSDDEAKKRAIAIWQRVQSRIEVVPVENDIVAIIKKLQNNNVRVMALTARSKPVVDRTIELLYELGIDFSPNNRKFSSVKLYDNHDVKIKNGIIFIGPLNNKGKVLLRFLEKTNLHPNKIIFIDDKREHALSVNAALNNIGIDHLVIRYSATDKAVENFSSKIADKQLEVFNKCNKFISDAYAAKNLKIKVDCHLL